jgi:nicotinamidase-related amidase
MAGYRNAALLVIDIQKGLFTKNIPIYNAEKLLENVNHLIESAHQAGAPVFIIQHSSDAVLREGTEEWRLHPQIQPTTIDYLIHKRRPCAVEGTALKQELDSLQIKCVVVTGLVTHGCVKSTCIGAHDLGYKVILVEDGHSNYHRKARQVIDEWNQKLSQETVELKATREIGFLPATE